MATAGLLLLFPVCVFTAHAAEMGLEPSKFSRGGYFNCAEANGWLKFHRVPATWDDARFICHLEGGVLASPLHEGLRSAMSAELKAIQISAFTGVRALGGFDYYHSIEGVPVEDMPVDWAPGEPNNQDDNERCITMTPESMIADVPCNDRHPYLCFKNRNAGLHVNIQCDTPDRDYAKANETGSCYKYHQESMTWSRAHAVCSAEGGSLAVINSNAEAQVIQRLLMRNPKADAPCDNNGLVFIGIYNWAKKNLPAYWATLDGKTLEEAGFASWREGEPNNVSQNKNCGTVVRGYTIFLNDYDCEKRLPFICELRPFKPGKAE